jgi:hypothetical protein
LPRLRRGLGLAAAALVLPLVYVLGVLRPRALRGEGVPSPDLYGYTGPLLHYAQRAWEAGGLRVLENPNALPRAYFAPRARVVADPRETLQQLASRDHDPRRTVLLASAPRDGFLGNPAPDNRRAHVDIEVAHGESLEISVHSPADGFLVLSDQYFPGWTATVAGEPAEILRANLAFRAVHVPSGASRVEFRYRPASLYWGVGVSVVTALALVAFATLAPATRPLKVQSPSDRPLL